MSAPQVTALGRGLHRVTLPLPFAPSHVHCYALEAADGWTVVDAGARVPGARERWEQALAELGWPAVRRIVVTHFHPDHVGAAADLAELTSAEIWQSAGDERQARAVFEGPDLGLDAYLRRHGMPDAALADPPPPLGALVRLPARVRNVGEQDSFAAAGTTWRLVHLPGHADHQHGLIADDGRFLCGDHLLDAISPTVGLYPGASEDPLGDYLSALGRAARLGARVAYAGHGEPIEDVAGCAGGIDGHHVRRLHEHRGVLEREGAVPAHAVSVAVFGDRRSPVERRLALHETLAHLVRLERAGTARSHEDEELVWWEAA